MLEVGVQSNNLPAVLTLLADHYHRRHTTWTRLKGLLVYPLIVLVAAFVLSCFLSVLLKSFVWPSMALLAGRSPTAAVCLGLWRHRFCWVSRSLWLSWEPRCRVRAAPCAGGCRPSKRP